MGHRSQEPTAKELREARTLGNRAKAVVEGGRAGDKAGAAFEQQVRDSGKSNS